VSRRGLQRRNWQAWDFSSREWKESPLLAAVKGIAREPADLYQCPLSDLGGLRPVRDLLPPPSRSTLRFPITVSPADGKVGREIGNRPSRDRFFFNHTEGDDDGAPSLDHLRSWLKLRALHETADGSLYTANGMTRSLNRKEIPCYNETSRPLHFLLRLLRLPLERLTLSISHRIPTLGQSTGKPAEIPAKFRFCPQYRYGRWRIRTGPHQARRPKYFRLQTRYLDPDVTRLWGFDHDGFSI